MMNEKQFTKRYAKMFAKGSVNPKKVDATARELNSVRYADNKELLNRCRNLYDNFKATRSRMQRATRYTFGEQWGDYIQDPDSRLKNRLITEEQYIKNTGKVPLKYNIIRKSEKAVIGLYRNSKPEPLCVSRIRDKQKLGEMMTVAMQYAYQVNNIMELNCRLLEQCFCTGLFVRSCYYRFNHNRQMTDVYVQNENPYMIFFNDTLQDTLFRDLNLIGAIRDMELGDIISMFARNEQEAKMLVEEYRNVPTRNEQMPNKQVLTEGNYEQGDFFLPSNVGLCRFYEVWTEEKERCLYCHDTAKGEECYRPLEDEEAILMENAMRVEQMEQAGGTADDAALIEYEWKVRKYWYVRYLTPNGKCIMEGESPYDHGGHPFTISGYPMINGTVYSPAEELIDIQRVINRTLSQIDFMRQNGAKNVLMCPVDAVPENMTFEDFASEYTRNGSVLFYKPNKTGQIPQQLKSQSVAAGDIDIINLYLKLNEEISGVTGAMRGERATSQTPASLYMQQAENATNNLADFIGWFNTNVKNSDYKMMTLIQQYVDDERYMPLVGDDYREESHYYDPQKIRECEFEMAMIENQSTFVYRLAFDQMLMEAMKNGVIDFATFLESSSAPYADKLLNKLKAKQEAMESGDMSGMSQEDIMAMQNAMQQGGMKGGQQQGMPNGMPMMQGGM